MQREKFSTEKGNNQNYFLSKNQNSVNRLLRESAQANYVRIEIESSRKGHHWRDFESFRNNQDRSH